MSLTEIKYRTFDDLMNEVTIDLKQYAAEGMIENAELIKIAQKINYELGLRIHMDKDCLLEVSRGRVKLPADFYVMNHAMICGTYVVEQPIITGRQTEDALVACLKCHKPCTSPDDPCYKPDECCRCNHVYTNDCGDSFEVIEKKAGHQTHIYRQFGHIHFKKSTGVSANCFNTRQHSEFTAEIKNGFIYTNLENGKLYINYLGNLEDDEGNLLVIDHPMLNEYYEYGIKSRILENLFMNGEDVANRMQLVEQRLTPARNNAMSMVNMPDFAELKAVHDMNRKAMHKKYYSQFYS